jgi:hypothetical protein
VELGLIESFPQIWRTRTFWSFQRRVSTQVSLNSHNAHCYFPCTARLFCVPRKHAYFTTLTVCTYCTWTLSFWGKKRGTKSVYQVRLVKDMHVKYKQDNLHCMTWYTGTCSSNGHGLTIHVSFMVKCVRNVRAVDLCDLDATIPNGSVTIGRTSLVGVGHSGSDPIMPLVLRTVCYAMAGALTLYYRSLGTASTLLRRGNISGRPYC